MAAQEAVNKGTHQSCADYCCISCHSGPFISFCHKSATCLQVAVAGQSGVAKLSLKRASEHNLLQPRHLQRGGRDVSVVNHAYGLMNWAVNFWTDAQNAHRSL